LTVVADPPTLAPLPNAMSPPPDPLRRIPCLEVARIHLPPVVARLHDLAYNLWWTWNPPARHLFRALDQVGWDLYHNPVQLLLNLEPGSWTPLLRSPGFRKQYEEVVAALDAYVGGDGGTWYARQDTRLPGPVAYFSTEFGLHHSLAIYSGGLGVLSGDHLKSASDLGLPLVAVGLLYRQGYFHQTLDADGRQQHFYPTHDFTRLPMRPAIDDQGRALEVAVPLPGREVALRVWLAQVGRVPLLLLDSDVTRNDPADRVITNQLYVQGREMRLIQELALGIGGVRALAALGIVPAVWHANEGHCSLLQLERLAGLKARLGSWESAVSEVRRGVAFTTHTPVPAGNERFDTALARRYLEPWSELCEVPVETLLELGDDGERESFNLSILGLRTSRTVNAVSQRNTEVVRDMWSELRRRHPDIPEIVPVTNGVHTPSWVGPEIGRLFDHHVGSDWRHRLLEPDRWQALLAAPEDEVWRAHRAQKVLLGRFLEGRLREQFARHGSSPDELRRVVGLFDPDSLTIGFARRFATYKRAHLLFADVARLRRLIASQPGGVQIVVAGKAHPADQEGQELIRRVFQLGMSPELEGRIVFLEDYDLLVAKMLVQGVDVWLNTPRPPLEASGTSGQKAALNGALNLSVLDGWWPEAFDGENGWALGAETDRGAETGEQDRADAESLYSLLENDVLPLFARREEGLPKEWIGRMRRAMASVTPAFSSHRMVRDYLESVYQVACATEGRRASQEKAS